jgi:hypothetical protein
LNVTNNSGYRPNNHIQFINEDLRNNDSNNIVIEPITTTSNYHNSNNSTYPSHNNSGYINQDFTKEIHHIENSKQYNNRHISNKQVNYNNSNRPILKYQGDDHTTEIESFSHQTSHRRISIESEMEII